MLEGPIGAEQFTDEVLVNINWNGNKLMVLTILLMDSPLGAANEAKLAIVVHSLEGIEALEEYTFHIEVIVH